MSVPWPEIAAHRERLVRVAARRVPTREDAEDVVSEAMLRCATFPGLDEERLGQFLTAVTVRLCADFHRDTERGLRLVRRIHVGEEHGPEDLACAAADAETLHAVLRRLPERQRDVLVDRASGLSVSQISSRHALTYKGAESALSRARAQMRAALATAMALLWGAADFLRRRPDVESAVPVAAVAAVAVAATLAVPVAPGTGTGAPSAAPPPARASGERPSSGHVPAAGVAPDLAPAAARSNAVGGTDARPDVRPTPRPTPSPTETYVEFRKDGLVASVTEDRGDRPYSQDVRDCLRYGPAVENSPAVSPKPTFYGRLSCNRS